MRTNKTILIVGFCSMLFAVNMMSKAKTTGDRGHAGIWDSTIYNRSERPRTVGIRLEVIDSGTGIPVEGAQVRLWGMYIKEWVGTPRDWVGSPPVPQEKEYEIKAKTDEDGIVVFALGWQKEYPWHSYFGDHAPRDYRKDGGYSVKDAWVRAVDDVEKVQRIEIRHPKYNYKKIPFNFKHLLDFGQDNKSSGQAPRIFDAFEKAWIKEIKRKDVKFCVLDLGTKFPDFQKKKSKRPEFFKKIRNKDWGTVYQKPLNWFSVGEHPQSHCGPYFVYVFDDVAIQKRTVEIELTSTIEGLKD